MPAIIAGSMMVTSVTASEPGYPEPKDRPVHVREIPIPPQDVGEGAIPTRQSGHQFYDFGPVSADEQHYIEFINRARRDPGAEGKWLQELKDPEVVRAVNFFNSDLNTLLTDNNFGFQTFDVGEPIAPNAKLYAAARSHTLDMFENTYQGHKDDAGLDSGDRIILNDYSWSTFGENVFSTSKGNLYGHAGFQIDWGLGPNGIQNPPGHRVTIHNTAFKEIGISVFHGSKTKLNDGNPRRQDVGPQLVTQVFATSSPNQAFITGVAFYDLNNNQFYDPGEGIPSLRVESLEGTWFTTSATSGGFTIPANGNGNYTLKLSDGFQSRSIGGVTVAGNKNTKADLMIPFSPLSASGPDMLSTLHTLKYSLPPVFGAESYQWRLRKVVSGTLNEGAESDSLPFEADVLQNPVIQTTKASSDGNRSFHLFHNTNPPHEGTLTWERNFKIGPGSSLSFMSRHAVAASSQVARVEIKPVESDTWVTLWSDPGKGQPGDRSFSRQDVSLSDHIGQIVNIRFAYGFIGGSFFPVFGDPDPFGVGWYFDNVNLSDVEEIFPEASGEVSAASAEFPVKPGSVGTYILDVRPQVNEFDLPWGPELRLAGVAQNIEQGGNDPVLEFTGASLLSGNLVALNFLVTGEESPQFALSASASVTGGFTPFAGVFNVNAVGGGAFQIIIPTDNAPEQMFFQVELK